MSDPTPHSRGFFDTLPPVAPLAPPVTKPVANLAAPVETPTVAPIALFTPPKDRKRKDKRVRKAVKPSELATWLAIVPGAVFLVVVTPANPAFGILVIGLGLVLTGVYTVVFGRPGWARISRRRVGLAPIALGVGLLFLTGVLPNSIVVAPKFLTAAPTPNAAQTADLGKRFEAIDSRFSTDWDTGTLVAKANDVCWADFASQTPEHEIAEIQAHLTFSAEPKLTPTQAAQVLDAVRESYCGQPGLREDAVKSELKYTIPALWPLALQTVDVAVGWIQDMWNQAFPAREA